ncbi:hypothetical protein ACQP1U_00030 [Actinomycetota bacterium]
MSTHREDRAGTALSQAGRAANLDRAGRAATLSAAGTMAAAGALLGVLTSLALTAVHVWVTGSMTLVDALGPGIVTLIAFTAIGMLIGGYTGVLSARAAMRAPDRGRAGVGAMSAFLLAAVVLLVACSAVHPTPSGPTLGAPSPDFFVTYGPLTLPAHLVGLFLAGAVGRDAHDRLTLARESAHQD